MKNPNNLTKKELLQSISEKDLKIKSLTEKIRYRDNVIGDLEAKKNSFKEKLDNIKDQHNRLRMVAEKGIIRNNNLMLRNLRDRITNKIV